MIMKKILSLLALAIIASCSTLTPSSDNETLIKKFNSYDVTLPEVEKYAYAKYGNTKGDLIDIEALVRDSDTLGYVLNYGEGWEVLSGDKRCTPILAKGDGHYLFDSLIPPQKIWFESELEKIGAIKDGYGVQTKSGPSEGELFWQRINAPTSLTKAEGDPIEDNQYWELVEIIDWDYDVYTTGHLIQTKWGQEYPWNMYCPGPALSMPSSNAYPAGCAPVAGAQLLYFLHYRMNKPQSFYQAIQGSPESPIFSGLSMYTWDDMAIDRSEVDIKDHHLSARLIRWVGKKIDVDYNEVGTDGKISKFESFLEEMHTDLGGSQLTFKRDDYDDMERDISYYLRTRNQPCVVFARKNQTMGVPSGPGHAWLIDGYRTATTTQKYVYRWTSRTDNHLYDYGEIREEYIETEYEYILMNWGWEDANDNYLYSPNIGHDWIIQTDEGPVHYQYGVEVFYDFN